MEFYEPQNREALIPALVTVWEASVRETHRFLSPAEIAAIRPQVPEALEAVEHLLIAQDSQGEAVGFLGAEQGRLEMLFLAPAARGKGLGRQLLELGIRRYKIRSLTVNEQNPQALGFYEHCGFQVCRRTARDEAGRPYPLLYMELAETGRPEPDV